MADTSNTTVELVRLQDPVQITERIAVAAFIAGYSGGTRVSYSTDLRISRSGATTAVSTC